MGEGAFGGGFLVPGIIAYWNYWGPPLPETTILYCQERHPSSSAVAQVIEGFLKTGASKRSLG